MALHLYFHCSWEYLPDKDDTYVTYNIDMLSFLETVLETGQTLNTYLKHAFNSTAYQKKIKSEQSSLFCLT